MYRDLVTTIGKIIGMPRPIVSIPPWFGLAVARVVGRVLGDVLVTRDEIAGLMAELLYVPGAPSKGTTRLTDWAREAGQSANDARQGLGPPSPAHGTTSLRVFRRGRYGASAG